MKTVYDLIVFQKAYEHSLAIHKISLGFPPCEKYGIADQIRRSTKSVCSNLVEGYSKYFYSKNEFKRYLSISIGSSDETKLWLMYCKDLGYIEHPIFDFYTHEYTHISKMLMTLYKKTS